MQQAQVLDGLCEYLVLTIYARPFTGQMALTRFLALVLAGIQALEFALLYLVSRPLLERSGPIAGNLIFPATSLACLVGWRSVRSCRPRSSAKVVAAGGCTLLRLHRIVFHDPSRDYPDMLVELCKLLARRLRRAEDRARGSQVARSGPAR